jgi:rare lipoprotein A (peptidoglycan hydrolase)
MRRHPLSFWVYWIIVIAAVGFTGENAATGRIISVRTVPDSNNSMPDQPSSEPIALPDTVLAEAIPEYRQVGIASWYGGRHQGRLTASGEVFDENKLTAAHRTLPLVTWARVTNLENGRSVEVEVNDRGPYIDGRVIDLSTRAAEELGMTEQGLARVEITALPEQTASSAVE